MEKAKVTERELAHALCAMQAQMLVDEAGQVTMSGTTLSELYFNKFCNIRANILNVAEEAQAIRHWVAAVGYGKDNEFDYILSDTILNC